MSFDVVFLRKAPWPKWKKSANGTINMPTIYFTPKNPMKINDRPARRAVERFQFFRENLIPKLFVAESLPIDMQIAYDRNSSRKDYWMNHIFELSNERL